MTTSRSSTRAGRQGLAAPSVALISWVLVACEEAPPDRSDVDRPHPAAVAVGSEAAATVLDASSDAALDRELMGGETHGYSIELAENQVLDVRVEQRGIDVVVELLGPLGQSLAVVDNPSGADGAYGQERVFWVAEQAGLHGLRVRAWGRAVTAGRYSICAEGPRTATSEDRSRAVAETAKADADRLFGEATRESWRRAVARYQEALAGFVSLEDDDRRADALFRLGETWRVLGEKNLANRVYEDALALYEANGNRRQEALTLHQLCRLFYYERTRVDLALERCQRAVPLWEATGDRLGLAWTSNSLGLFYRLVREDHHALIWFDRALELWQDLARPEEEARTLNNRGRLYAALGEYRQAEADLEMALDKRRALGRPLEIADTLYSLGSVKVRSKGSAAARAIFQEALAIRPDRGDLTTANLLFGLGMTLHELEDEQAVEAIRRSLQIFRAIGFRRGEGVAWLGLGRILAAGNRHAEARESLAKALEIFESIRDYSGLAETRLAIGDAERGLGRLEQAKMEIERALAILEDLRTTVAAGGDLRSSFFATKQVYYDRYVDVLMEMHSKRPSAGYHVEALTVSDRARARSLIEALADRRYRLRQHADSRLLEEEASIKRSIYANQARMQRLLERADPDPLAARELEREEQDLLRRYEKLQGQIRFSSSRSADLAPSSLLSSHEIQGQILDTDSLLLAYRLGSRRSFLWAVTPETITAFELPAREEIEELTWRTYQQIANNDRVARVRVGKNLAELGRVLLEPVAAQLRQARQLLIIADGALHYLPFEALPLPGVEASVSEPAQRLIVAAIEVTYLPSASTLAILRERLAGRQPASGLLALLADPVYCSEDPRMVAPDGDVGDCRYQRLVHSGREAAAILRHVPPESRFLALGFDASRDAVDSGKLGRDRILHFATHGDLSSEHAGLSRLVLSLFDASGRPREDGFWYAYEIYGENLPAELVVLSACHTALGEPIQGEGLVGLTHSFLNAGAARVVVGLWQVDDRSTAALMGSFYEHLLARRLSPPRALRAAKEYVRRQEEWQSPYYWAGFVLRGEWRDFAR